jgi:hypothetical protein
MFLEVLLSFFQVENNTHALFPIKTAETIYIYE